MSRNAGQAAANASASGTGGRNSGANYFIVQVFVQFSEQPQTPMILRVDDGSTVAEVTRMALEKYKDQLQQAPSTAPQYHPPSIAVADYVLKVSKGDGSADRLAPSLDPSGLLREQGLLFPYMVALSLDPLKDHAQMQLTQQYKEYLIAKTRPQPNQSTLGYDSRTSPLSSPLSGGGATPSKAGDATFDNSNVLGSVGRNYGTLQGTGETPAERQARERQGVMFVESHREKIEIVEQRRQQNIDRIQAERKEKERQHLEACEKRERERRAKQLADKAAEEDRQMQALEEKHKVELQQRMEQAMREERARELIEAQKRELEKEQKERQRRHDALERERAVRRQQAEEEKRNSNREKSAMRENSRAQRMTENLTTIIDKLHYELDLENRMRVELLERERIEREAEERLEREREYTRRIERQRKMAKDAANEERMEQELRERRMAEERAQKEREERERERIAEEQRFAQWRQRRKLEQEKSFRERQLELLTQQEKEGGNLDDDFSASGKRLGNATSNRADGNTSAV